MTGSDDKTLPDPTRPDQADTVSADSCKAARAETLAAALPETTANDDTAEMGSRSASGPPSPDRVKGAFEGDVTREDPSRYRAPDGADEDTVIGRGGMGRVLLAYDAHLGRDVALKELLPAPGETAVGPGETPLRHTAAQVARFLREARVTAQLEHPSIVPVYELGRRADGALYYTMRLIRGKGGRTQTLQDELEACQSLHDRLALLDHVTDLCQAMAYAHSRGVVHRDIKPANVMVGEFGETVVLDWGLAKVRGQSDEEADELARRIRALEGGHDETVAGAIMGTPAYMSPEQADPERIGEIDERSDVWALGAVLYTVLAGRPPLLGDSLDEVLDRLKNDPVPPVREAAPGAPDSLVTLVERALVRPRDERTITARELAEGLAEFARSAAETEAIRQERDRAVEAEQVARKERRRVVRGRRWLLAAAIVVLAVVAGGWWLSDRQRRRAVRAERRAVQAARFAREETRRADTRRKEAARFLARYLLERAQKLHESHQQASAALHATVALTQHDDPLLRGRAIRYLSEGFADPGPIWRRIGPANEIVLDVEISADQRLVTVRSSSQVAVLSATDGRSARPARLLPRRRDLLSISRPSPDGQQIAELKPRGAGNAFDGGELRIVDARTKAVRRRLATVSEAERIHSLAWSTDGTLLAAGDAKGVRLWRLPAGAPAGRLRCDGHVVSRLVFQPGGALLAGMTFHGDAPVCLWNARTGKRIARAAIRCEFRGRLFDQTDIPVELGLAFSPDGEVLAAGCWNGVIRFFRGSDLSFLGRVRAHYAAVFDLSFFRDGRRLVSGSGDHRVAVWRMPGHWRSTFRGIRDAVLAVQLGPGGDELSAGAVEGYQRWRIFTGRSVATLRPLKLGPIPARLKQEFQWEKEKLGAAAFSPTGGLLAFARGTVTCLAELRGRKIRHCLADESRVSTLAFSPDGSRLASGAGGVALWNVATGKQLNRFQFGKDPVQAAAFSPDGRLLAVGQPDALHLLQVDTLRPRFRFVGPPHSAWSLAFSRDGRYLVAGSAFGVLVYDLRGRRLLQRMICPGSVIRAVAFSPDGRLVAAGQDGGQISVWDLDGQLSPAPGHRPKLPPHSQSGTGGCRSSGPRLLAVLPGHKGAVTSLAFGANGALLVTGAADKTVQLFRLADLRTGPHELFRKVRKRLGKTAVPLEDLVFPAGRKTRARSPARTSKPVP